LLQRQPIDSVQDLNKHTLIIHEARRDGWQRWAQSLGIDLRPKKIVRFDSMNTAAEAAEHGVNETRNDARRRSRRLCSTRVA
jgi:DNA-binding transcriptional LysR family regulator